jgi:hypothetical protein
MHAGASVPSSSTVLISLQGAVVTEMQLYEDMLQFFKGNKTGVYRWPCNGAE